MLLLTISLIAIIIAITFHNLFLMKAVEECPLQVGTMTLEEAKAEREYAIIRASFYV